MKDYLRKLLFVLPASKSSLIFAVLLFILSSCIEAIGIGLVGPFISLASDFSIIEKTPALVTVQNLLGIEQNSHFVATVGLIAVLVFLLKTLTAWGTQVYITRFSDRQQRQLLASMANGYLNAPYSYHITKNSSTIIDRFIEVANTFSNTIFMPLLTTLANLCLFVTLFILLCFASLPIMIGLLIALCPVLIFFNSFSPRIRSWGRQMRDSKADIIQTINHAFGSVKETKTIGCENYFEDQIVIQARKLEEAHRTFVAFRILPRFLLESVIVASVMLTISISIFTNGEGISGTTSVLGIFALASIRLLPAITNSINGVNQLRASSYTIDQIYFELSELMSFTNSACEEKNNTQCGENQISSNNRFRYSNILTEKDSSKDFIPGLVFSNRVNINNISYKYTKDSRYVLSDLSITIRKGESIAFVGKSGAGKTTLVDIILGLLLPQTGDILVDGNSIYNQLDRWRNMIAYIPQSIFLTDESIERNIAFGVPEHLINRSKVDRAIKVAQLDEVVNALPNGVNTTVGERGILLSGGQRQRVGIARAIYHDSEILVLDEATSALDSETEDLVTSSILSLSSAQNLTTITIAHRLTTIKNCDMIYALEKGRIVKSGSYSAIFPSD